MEAEVAAEAVVQVVESAEADVEAEVEVAAEAVEQAAAEAVEADEAEVVVKVKVEIERGRGAPVSVAAYSSCESFWSHATASTARDSGAAADAGSASQRLAVFLAT